MGSNSRFNQSSSEADGPRPNHKFGSWTQNLERAVRAEKRLEESPWDVESWMVLVREAQSRPIEEVRPFYEQLVAKFPTCGRFWKFFIEHEMKSRNYDRVEKLFQKCLIKVLLIDLWRLYLQYIKEAKTSLATFREQMAKAYDFALDRIGLDISSYPIWTDYINFLKNVEAVGSYAENQKITAVRKVYQRGVVNPMSNIELLWKEYISYEQSINPMIAEKMIADRSREYMNARRVAKEYEAMTRGLNKLAPSIPPQSTPEELRQVELWRKYISWEKSNPLRTEESSLIIKRVVFAYEQALLCLGHHPDIWYEYASFLDEHSKTMAEKGDANQFKILQEDAASVYERATNLLKSNQLLHFAYADFEEARNRREKADKVFMQLLENNKDESFDPTLAYIQYMKFARRTEGIKAARIVFKKAREDPRTKHQAYISAAQMEYYCSKDKNVACKIYELGLKKFSDSPDFAMAYIDFLSHLNEENNTRVLFERILTSGQLTSENQVDLWNKFLEFETGIGDLSSVLKIEKRRSQALVELIKPASDTCWLVDRYRFLDLFPCSVPELKSLGYTPSGTLQAGSPFAIASQILANQQGTVSSSAAGGPDVSDSRPLSNVSRPNIGQMLPFKPKFNALPGSHSVPGGVFPPPQAVASLLTQLPHPSSFRGPFVDVERLLEIIRQTPFKNAADYRSEGYKGGNGVKFFDQAVQRSTELHGAFNLKRAAAAADDENNDNDDEGANSGIGGGAMGLPPNADIYRLRQLHKRIRSEAS